MFLAEKRNLALDPMNTHLKLIAKELGWPFLDRLGLSCNKGSTQCAFFSDEGKSYYSDYGHWTSAGAKYFGQRLFENNFLEENTQ